MNRELSRAFGYMRQSRRLFMLMVQRFCSAHVATLEAQDMAEFKLHRDILHAACQPVVRVFKAASRVASIIRPTRPTADLELAFSGDARDFYVWLQSVLADEDGFCATNGCPACIVLRVFYSLLHAEYRNT
jgi:hypothetical protein